MDSTISCENTTTKITTELELIKEIPKSLQQTTKPTSYTCHHCKRSGHIKRYCPLLIGSSTVKMHGTINSVLSASISASRPHSCLVNNKNVVTYSVNDPSLEKSLSNKTQAGIDTHQVLPVFPFSAFSSSNISLQQSSLNFAIGSPSKDDDAKLSPIRSAHPGARPSHIVSRSSPYQLSYGHVRRRSIHKTAAGISCDNLIAIPREIPGALQDKSGAVLLFQDKWRK
ncbi:unnamed protein product [Rotaria sp. Silwood2]|nr:unnamed protein product [Rotaria sp. Silwood2]